MTPKCWTVVGPAACLLFCGVPTFGQAPAGSPAAAVWNALSAPAMDAGKFAHTENVDIVRDRVHINLTDGTIQFVQPVNGVVFGAVFHGKGRLQSNPPNPQEAQQLAAFYEARPGGRSVQRRDFQFHGWVG